MGLRIIQHHKEIHHKKYQIIKNNNSSPRDMYTPGYFPTDMTTFGGLKMYRNYSSGIFLHKCHSIKVDNGLFDNIGIDIDRAKGIQVKNTIIIGESNSYRILMKRQPTVNPVCSRNSLNGIDLHT
jgi:hypothetical protein